MDIIGLANNPSFYHLLTIFIIFFITWRKSLYGGWCIDDDEGIAKFSERWQPEARDPSGKIVETERVIDSYSDDNGNHKFLSLNKSLGFPGCFMRWHRLHIGKKFQIIGRNSKGHDIYGYVQSPFKHHVWSFIVFSGCLLLCYRLLSILFTPEIAFAGTLLFSIHPIISQCIAWISGINYLYSFFFILLNCNILNTDMGPYITIPATVICTALAGMTLLPGCFTFAILLIMGFKWAAFASAIVGLLVIMRDGLFAVNFRRNEFKRQNMTNSIYPNLRKPIVMFKTLFYYTRLIVYPRSLGLYHTFGYHYHRKDEEPDRMALGGFLVFLLSVFAFFTGSFIIKFSIIWFYSFFFIFSNFITANQFVVDRYVFIPSFGYAIIFSAIVYPIQPLFWFLIGFYAMRSIMHVWTYKDQVSFYTSNILNFPESEVAYGNLGVAYQGRGKSGTAFDLWQEATRINPHYDVPWYNMHSLVKSAGDLEKSYEYLKNCMNAKVVHFNETWKREMDSLEAEIKKKKTFDLLNKEMSDAINSNNTHLIPDIKKKMEELMGKK